MDALLYRLPGKTGEGPALDFRFLSAIPLVSILK